MANYPPEKEGYTLVNEVTRLVNGASIYDAECTTRDFAGVRVSIIARNIQGLDLNLEDGGAWLQREAANLNHPSIVSPLAYFAAAKGRRSDEELWVVMPPCIAASTTLKSIINSPPHRTGLSEECVAIILQELLSALEFLHENGHTHGGVYPGNVIVDSDGAVKLADFGFRSSVYRESTLSAVFNSQESPYFMPYDCTERTTEADVWCLGITAMELFLGVERDEDKIQSAVFTNFIRLCICGEDRQTAGQLLRHPFVMTNGNDGAAAIRNLLLQRAA